MKCVRAQGAAAWSQDIYLGRHPCMQGPRLGAVKGHPEWCYLPAADCEARTPLGSQRLSSGMSAMLVDAGGFARLRSA